MILITGASSGIGEATARVFAEQKKKLFLVARRRDRLAALAEELKSKNGIEVRIETLDVSEREDVERFFISHAAALSKVEVLVNNAGLARGRDFFQEGSPDHWDEMIDTNIKGLLSVTRGMLPHFIKKGSGHIVNLGSAAAFSPYLKGNAYCATKAAVKAFTECLRLDLNGTGVRVTEVSPGMVETEFSVVRLRDEAEAKKVYAGMTPLSAQDVAETIAWCVNRPAHVNIQEVLLYPTDQASTSLVHRRS